MDKGYDSDSIRAFVVNQRGGIAAISPNTKRATMPDFDEYLYSERYRIENLFSPLKSYRRIATRYEKLRVTFAAMVSLACILVWLKI